MDEIFSKRYAETKTKNLQLCVFCGLENKRVECAGIFFCPNLICSGPGAAWFRSRCKTCKEDGSGHTVSPADWLFEAEIYVESDENKYGDVIFWHEGFEKILRYTYANVG